MTEKKPKKRAHKGVKPPKPHATSKEQTEERHDPQEYWMMMEPFAVHLRMLSLYEQGGICSKDIIRAYIDMEEVGQSADRFQNRTTRTGEVASIFNRTVRAIAVLSYLPGGVPFEEQKYEAESFLAGIIGKMLAQEHVTAALHCCFGNGPISTEPLQALWEHMQSGEGADLTQRVVPGFLAPESPTDEQLAEALLIFLVIRQFLVSRRSHHSGCEWGERETSIDAEEKLRYIRDCASAIMHLPSISNIASLLGETARTLPQGMLLFEHLRTSKENEEEFSTTRALFSFAYSPDGMRRAVFQHLLILSVMNQVEGADLNLPGSQEYRVLLDILKGLVEKLVSARESGE